MAAILNGFLPARKKDQYAQDKILNTRWGDSGISAPIHGGWSTQSSNVNTSPDLDRDLPPTPPQTTDNEDGVYIVRDETDQDSEEDEYAAPRENASITIPLPWKKKVKQPQHARKPSIPPSVSSRFPAAQRIDFSLPLLATAEAAAVPLPESRISSPINRDVVNSPLNRHGTTSPVLSFRSRLTSPNLGEMLSPVAEGFAKSGPSSRPTPVLSPLHYVQSIPLDRPPTASSMRSTGSRRSSLNSYTANNGMGLATMSSQGPIQDQSSEIPRPQSRGIGSTAHMRASSRGPSSRAQSVEPMTRRAASVEPINTYHDNIQTVEVVIPNMIDVQPVRRRTPSVEPSRRRAPSVEPVRRRAPSVEPGNRRAASREPRGRRGFSVEPTRRRHKSEAPRKTTRDSFSSNDGSDDTESEKETSDNEQNYRNFTSRRPRRRRSIASPMSSPTAAVFQPTPPLAMDSIAARAGLIRPAAPVPIARPRPRSMSRTRGLYGEMADDFRLLARDVHLDKDPGSIHPTVSSPQSQYCPLTQQAPSPSLSSHSLTLTSGLAAAIAMQDRESEIFYNIVSDSERSDITSRSRFDNQGGKALLAAITRDRKDQLRREERERARERVVRRMERERERPIVAPISDCESTTSRTMTAAEKTRRVYGNSGLAGYDSDASLKSWGGRSEHKELVKNAEEMWG